MPYTKSVLKKITLVGGGKMGTEGEANSEKKMLQSWKFSSLKLHSTSFWKLQSNVSAVLEWSENLGNAS